MNRRAPRRAFRWATLACGLFAAASTTFACDALFGLGNLLPEDGDAGGVPAPDSASANPLVSMAAVDGGVDSATSPVGVGETDGRGYGDAYVDGGEMDADVWSGDGPSTTDGAESADASNDAGADGSDDAGVDASDDASCSGDQCGPITLAAPAYYVQGVVTDGTNVYWTDSVESLIFWCPISGCGQDPALFAFDISEGYPQPIVVSGGNVYWASVGRNGPGAIVGCTGDCPMYVSGLLADSQDGPAGLMTDGTNLYWTNGSSGEVMSCPAWLPDAGMNPCNPTALATGRESPGALAVQGDTIYWSDDAGIVTCPIAGCNDQPTVLVPGAQVYWLAVDENNVYWSDYYAGMIMECSIQGCDAGPTAMASDQPQGPEQIVIDTTNLYWVNPSTGLVMKCAIQGCGGTGTVIAQNQPGAGRMAIDVTHIFWATYPQAGVGAIMMLNK